MDNKINIWAGGVNRYNLEGIQLHADGGWSSTFKVDYQVKSIPTYVLIDAKGNIISPYAPAPSSKELRNLIDEKLKEL